LGTNALLCIRINNISALPGPEDKGWCTE